MSLFSSIKSSLGLSKARQESKGHRLGNGSDKSASKATSNQGSGGSGYFTRDFQSEKLGMSVAEVSVTLPGDNVTGSGAKSRPEVTDIALNSEAAQKGIQRGDIIISLGGYELQSFNEFFDIIGGLDRPLQIK